MQYRGQGFRLDGGLFLCAVAVNRCTICDLYFIVSLWPAKLVPYPSASLAGFFFGEAMTFFVDALFVAAAGVIVVFAIRSRLAFLRR